MDNLNSALTTWNEKLAEIWTLISTSPENFKGGGVWTVIQNINGALQAVGYGLLVLFFAAGVVKTCGSFAELKKPEMAFRRERGLFGQHPSVGHYPAGLPVHLGALPGDDPHRIQPFF